jgi:RNA polymerase-binding transcription factor
MDPERARELLAAERKRLEDLIALNESDELADLTDDDRNEHLNDAELDAGLVEQYRDELTGVERAEARLAAGTYGRSVQSGEPIPDARLEVFPTAELTIDEQNAAEGR